MNSITGLEVNVLFLMNGASQSLKFNIESNCPYPVLMKEISDNCRKNQIEVKALKDCALIVVQEFEKSNSSITYGAFDMYEYDDVFNA